MQHLLDWFDRATIAALAKGWPDKAFVPILIITVFYFGIHLAVYAVRYLGSV